MSAKCPRMWLSISTFACPALAARSSRSIVRLSVTPTKTGTAPTLAIAPGTGASVNAFVNTFSPGLTSSARSAVAIAYPPALHHLHRGANPLFGDRLLLGETAFEDLAHGLLLRPRAAQVNLQAPRP